jgi:hypothetical protein
MQHIQEAATALAGDSVAMGLLKQYEDRVITLWNELSIAAGSLRERQALLRHEYHSAYVAYRTQLEIVRSGTPSDAGLKG